MERNGLQLPWILGFLALVVLLVGCAVRIAPGAHTPPAPERVLASSIQPPPRFVAEGEKPTPPLATGPRFPHPVHIELGVDCSDCHEMDADTGAMSMPERDVCWMCHEDLEEDMPPEKKLKGNFFDDEDHPLWTPAIVPYDAANVTWTHKPHVELGCDACHGAMLKADGPPRRVAPLFEMDGCVTCHETNDAPATCRTCHQHYDRDVKPPSHDGRWKRVHGPISRTQRHLATENDCAMCHDEPQDCSSCHARERPLTHLDGWLRNHGGRVMAGGRPMLSQCVFCHQDVHWCDRCHDVMPPFSHRHQWDIRHGKTVRAASEIDKARCLYCHDDQAFCETCHLSDPPRDHNNLFRLRTHGVMASIDRTRCMVCHTTDFCVRCHENTPPLSHRGMWGQGLNTHCVACHFPWSSNPTCQACHFEPPTHPTAPPKPATHTPGSNCRLCHNSVGGGGAPPLPHVDNGDNCENCHH